MLNRYEQSAPSRRQHREDHGQRNRAIRRHQAERQFGDGDHEEYAPGDVQHC